MLTRDCRIAFASLRTQAQVYPEDGAFRAGRRKNGRNFLREPHTIFAVGQRSTGDISAVLEKEKQVNVGAVVEFVAAELAQRESAEARVDDAAMIIHVLRRT